ncbi:MAG TPA: acyl-CoA thioesterase [Cyclobacteriaceae bacterium]|nr:acyl-CoA thioesterase [Cyclobacteriaceae bacterium]
MQIQIRWADIDQNRHLRHSVYYDYGAMARMEFLSSRGLSTTKLEELKIGPILFREECVFRREIKLEDKITLDIELVKAKHDFSRWSLRHNFYKEDGTVAAKLSIDGAWMDIEKRKLMLPPAFVQEIFAGFPKSEDFEWIGEQ